jgi:hypothetical protein
MISAQISLTLPRPNVPLWHAVLSALLKKALSPAPRCHSPAARWDRCSAAASVAKWRKWTETPAQVFLSCTTEQTCESHQNWNCGDNCACGAAVRICWNLTLHENSFKTLISMCKLLRSLRSWIHSYINAKVCAILHLDSRFNRITFCLPWKHCHIGNANMARASKVMSWPNFPVSPVRQAVLPMKTLDMIPCPMRWPPVISCKLK